MSYVAGYSQVVSAIIPIDAWEETFFSLMALKAHLQAIPGFQRMDIDARDNDEGEDVDVRVITNFEYQDQLLLWLEIGITVDSVLRSMKPEPKSLNVDVMEIIA